MTKSLIVLISTALTMSGCATLKPSTVIGASIGATVGSLAGAAIGSPEHAVRGAFIGATSGAAIGGFTGYLIGKSSETKIDPKNMNVVNDKSGMPAITRPDVNCVEIPDKIEDNGRRFIKRHVSCTIDRGSVWTME